VTGEANRTPSKKTEEKEDFELLFLLEAAHNFSTLHYVELNKIWVAASQNSNVSPIFLKYCFETQRIGQLDILIRRAEDELALAYKRDCLSALPIFGTNLVHSLSNSWISLSYELFRSVRQRAEKDTTKSAISEIFGSFFSELEIVRVQELKAEIAGFGSAKKAGLIVQMIPAEDSTNKIGIYEHGKTKLNSSPVIRPSDGSTGWSVFDVKKRAQVTIFRRDLSDKIISTISPIISPNNSKES
jgi:hypothetical protein